MSTEEAATIEAPETSFAEMSDSELADYSARAGGENASESAGESEASDTETLEESEGLAEKDDAQEPDYKAQIAELSKQMEGYQKMLARRETDYGEMKKALQEMQERRRQESEESFEDDFDLLEPKQKMEKIRELARLEQQRANESHMLQEQAIQRQREMITSRYPDFIDYVPEIANMVKNLSGENDPAITETLEQFKANPFNADATFLMMSAEAIKSRRAAEQLQVQMRELQMSKEDFARKIDQATRNRQTVTGGTSGVASNSGAIPPMSRRDIMNMSDSELEAQLKQLRKGA